MRTSSTLSACALTCLTLSCSAGAPHGAESPGAAPGKDAPSHATLRPALPPDEQAELRARYDSHSAAAVLHGRASYYSDSLAGNPTASGEPYDPAAFTAAHRTLPFGTILRVRRTAGGDPVYVRVNDRGPFSGRRRIVDLSRAAAEKLDLIQAGVLDVRVEVLGEAI